MGMSHVVATKNDTLCDEGCVLVHVCILPFTLSISSRRCHTTDAGMERIAGQYAFGQEEMMERCHFFNVWFNRWQ